MPLLQATEERRPDRLADAHEHAAVDAGRDVDLVAPRVQAHPERPRVHGPHGTYTPTPNCSSSVSFGRYSGCLGYPWTVMPRHFSSPPGVHPSRYSERNHF